MGECDGWFLQGAGGTIKVQVFHKWAFLAWL